MLIIQDENRCNTFYFQTFNKFIKYLNQHNDDIQISPDELQSLKARLKRSNHSFYAWYDFKANVKFCTDTPSVYEWKMKTYTAVPFKWEGED